MKGIGLKGIGVSPLTMKGGNYGLSPWDFDPVLVSFTPSMAKRATSVFAASPIVQGKRDGSGATDLITFPAGSLITGQFKQNFDNAQGSICFRITPEWNGNDGILHQILADSGMGSGGIYIDKRVDNKLYFNIPTTLNVSVDVSGWLAGTAYNVCIRWDVKNTLDGTNYACISINDVHTFGLTTKPIETVTQITLNVGTQYGSGLPANAIIEGLTIYRRVLYDGTYGVNVGNGDEVNLISAGVDPTTVTGSWDVVFCLPTNATPGALVTGTGEAWSHPHSSNLLTRGFLSDKYYGGGQWGVKLVGTGKIDCGSGATLDDLCAGGAVMQVEGWVRCDTFASYVGFATKGNIDSTGWTLYANTSYLRFNVDLATTDAKGFYAIDLRDGKWHHIVGSYNDTTKISNVAVDGVWGTPSTGVGNYVSDAALSVILGDSNNGSYKLTGTLGWFAIHNHAHYTPGTNFLPPRAAPVPDANTVEQWNLNEGTGTTATAQVTAPGNNGTITNGTWEPQWYDEGTPVRLRSVVGGASFVGTITRDAGIDNIADAAFTVDGWARISKNAAEIQMLSGKGTYLNSGWQLYVTPAGVLQGFVKCATTSATSVSVAKYADNLWHYFKMTFDDAGDRKIDLFIDNVEVTYSTETAGNGAVVDDSASNGYISLAAGPILSTGSIGWIRWSNVVRGAGMIPRSNPPAVDANTVGQWNCTEGAGTVLDNAEGTATRDGNITGNFSWNNSPAMESDSPGARNYAWGYVFGIDAPNEGFKQTISGSSAGADYVIRALGYSEDGLGIPGLVVYDETNSFILKTVLGTTGSTERTPDVLMCSFELPTTARYTGTSANCSVFSVKIINAGVTGSVVGFQQVELLANLLDNPSLDTGAVADPWIPYGWTNGPGGSALDAGDTEIETVLARSGGACIQANVGASNQYLYDGTGAGLANRFYSYGVWLYSSALASKTTVGEAGNTSLMLQTTLATTFGFTPSVTTAWKFVPGVARQVGVGASWMYIKYLSAGPNERYADDMYLLLLDDVSLTVTPASQANSAESGGIRVDGRDTCTQVIPAGRMFTNFGWLRLKYIPRHNGADVLKFETTPFIFRCNADGNNYFYLNWSLANRLNLGHRANGIWQPGGIWNTGGYFTAGTTYLIEVRYTGTTMEVIVDGVVRITEAIANEFTTVPNLLYLSDSAPACLSDAVFLAP